MREGCFLAPNHLAKILKSQRGNSEQVLAPPATPPHSNVKHDSFAHVT